MASVSAKKAFTSSSILFDISPSLESFMSINAIAGELGLFAAVLDSLIAVLSLSKFYLSPQLGRSERR